MGSWNSDLKHSDCLRRFTLHIPERPHRKPSHPRRVLRTISSELQVEGKLEKTQGKQHIRNYLLQEQCKFTVRGANKSQRVHATGCFYSNQIAQPPLIVLIRTLLLTLLECTEMKWKPGNLPFSPLVVNGKKFNFKGAVTQPTMHQGHGKNQTCLHKETVTEMFTETLSIIIQDQKHTNCPSTG